MLKLGTDANSRKNVIVLIGIQVAGDHKILVDSSDTIAGYLKDKLKEGAHIELVIENVGGNEQLRVDVSNDIATKSYADAGDTATLADAEAYTDGKIPNGTKGASLVNNGSNYQPITNGAAVTLNTDANLAPKVADGHTFFVDATTLASNRNIVPDATGAGECEGITFIVEVPSSGSGKSYTLVGQFSLALTQKMQVECVCRSGSFQIAEWKPYVGSL